MNKRVDIYPLFRGREFIGFRCVWSQCGPDAKRITALDIDIGILEFDDYIESLEPGTQVLCHFASVCTNSERSIRMNIIATIGNESHTTSRGWAKISRNGQKLTHREALSKEFLTKFGDKHAMWVECVFNIEPGDTITWEAGANAGSRGSHQTRQNLTLIVDPDAEVFETESIGYPAKNARLRGRLRLESDADADAAANHANLKADL